MVDAVILPTGFIVFLVVAVSFYVALVVLAKWLHGKQPESAIEDEEHEVETEEIEECATCDYFDGGSCRRRAPFVEVYRTDWCGDFEPLEDD